jgi:hypothetical protein
MLQPAANRSSLTAATTGTPPADCRAKAATPWLRVDNSGNIKSIEINNDGSIIAIGAFDNTVRLGGAACCMGCADTRHQAFLASLQEAGRGPGRWNPVVKAN